MGPSWVAGAIAAGPATMASLIAAGASFDYTFLWVVILSAAAGAVAQFLAMRLGLLTERGIVGVVEDHVGEGWAVVLVVDVVVVAGAAQFVIMNTAASVSASLTGVNARIWGLVWGIVLAAGLAGRGYRFIEFLSKALVTVVVLAFVASLWVVPVDYEAAVTGLVPSLPAGSGLIAAGILGGAVHITLITMQSYTMRARDWTVRDYDLAALDISVSMLGAFGVYSVAVFLVAASVLSDPELTAIGAGKTLGPLVGDSAGTLFLLGLGGAAVSTLGGNTVVPPFLVADKLGWGTSVSDTRYRVLLAGFALVSAAGAFIGGEVISQLVLVLALGTVGTPFAIAIVLYLLNSDAVSEPPSTLANAGGLGLLVVSGTLAVNFLREQAGSGIDVLSGTVLAFALLLGVATVVSGIKYVREEVLV
ncbi:NRAMP family divalent metal transporter [Halorubrum sp. Atlit-28R]|uniref:NRAMP family divalent metal transporter n=1 Tax=Halorubrum sp. Atlit-28R TaxID=2282129 RepID=UPI000EF17E06|nr:divalent metal cation transporter [Halorubrum sp. Atlit-28R]RLM49963.1 divalent metal cation transporter [Halorubrum sp. Atlit-28R]